MIHVIEFLLPMSETWTKFPARGFSSALAWPHGHLASEQD